MSAVPYIILSLVVGVIAGGLAFLVFAPSISQMGYAVLDLYRDQLQRIGFGTGQSAIISANASCDSANPHPQLGWYCMFYGVSSVLQYVAPLMIGAIVVVLVLKTLVVASAR